MTHIQEENCQSLSRDHTFITQSKTTLAVSHYLPPVADCLNLLGYFQCDNRVSFYEEKFGIIFSCSSFIFSNIFMFHFLPYIEGLPFRASKLIDRFYTLVESLTFSTSNLWDRFYALVYILPLRVSNLWDSSYGLVESLPIRSSNLLDRFYALVEGLTFRASNLWDMFYALVECLTFRASNL